jgi:hypothetical protein
MLATSASRLGVRFGTISTAAWSSRSRARERAWASREGLPRPSRWPAK